MEHKKTNNQTNQPGPRKQLNIQIDISINIFESNITRSGVTN